MATNVSFLGPVPHSDSETAVKSRESVSPAAESAEARSGAGQKDYFVERSGLRFAGTHLLADFWNARHLDNIEVLEKALREAVTACDATLLHVHLHHFSPNGGVSGVLVLAESHISIHTWPERDYAAVDIFMCGSCDPYKAIPVLRRVLETDMIQLNEQKRGVVP